MDETQIIEPTVPVTISASSSSSTKTASSIQETPAPAASAADQSALQDKEHRKALTRYCLRLLDRPGELVALVAGTPNRIGRSVDAHVCILDKSVSKSHARIQLTVDAKNDKLVKCELRDDGAVNNTRVIVVSGSDKKVQQKTVGKGHSLEIHLDDRVVFGSVKFQFSKVGCFLFLFYFPTTKERNLIF